MNMYLTKSSVCVYIYIYIYIYICYFIFGYRVSNAAEFGNKYLISALIV